MSAPCWQKVMRVCVFWDGRLQRYQLGGVFLAFRLPSCDFAFSFRFVMKCLWGHCVSLRVCTMASRAAMPSVNKHAHLLDIEGE